MVMNLKRSKQRELVYKTLCELKTHPTAEELYEILKKKMPRLSLSTVYRNLELLNSLGYIQKIDTGDRHKRFDGDPREHTHMHCIKCGRVVDIEMKDDFNFVDAIIDNKGFVVLSHSINFKGICPNCQEPKKHIKEEQEDVRNDRETCSRLQSPGCNARQLF